MGYDPVGPPWLRLCPTSLKNLLLVWDWTSERFSGLCVMSVQREKNSEDKQGFIEWMFDRFGRDARRLQLFLLSGADKSC